MSPNLFGDQIERVVGPVWASEARKDRMREELAAHLAAGFEEERARLGDEGAAAEAAIRRLGEAGLLTRSLQESVPWLERVLYARLLPHHRFEAWGRRRRDETLPRYAARITIWMTALIAAADLIGLPAIAAVQARPMDWRVTLAWATAQLVVLAVGTFVTPFLCEGMARALQGGSSRRYQAVLFAALSSVEVMALVLGFVLIVSVGSPHGQIFRQSDWLVLLVMALIAPILLILAARDTISWRRRQDRWGLSEPSR
jgi:hypothetical protein